MSGNHGRENGDSIELTPVTGTDAGANGSFAAQQQRAQALIGEASATHKSSTPEGQAETPVDVEANENATGHSTSAVEAQQELSRLLAAASRQNTTNTTTRAREDADAQDEYQAFSVRTNMLRNYWDGYHALSKFRRWILVLRLLIALAQVVSGIVVLALPTSLGDSFSFPETCDPEGMFVYLVLHISRVACSVPIDLYLGLSPHRSPRARRRGADGLAERERNRRVGSLRLDRKLGRLGDLLGFCHVVLFIVGNYVVWTSVECSHAPADSKPLFFTCVAMLSISYLIILEVALMVFVSTTSVYYDFCLLSTPPHKSQLVIFFLPLLIAVLNALGLSHRLPQRDIHPETGKIKQEDIEKYSRLVYFTPLLEELVDGRSQQKTDENTDACIQAAESSSGIFSKLSKKSLVKEDKSVSLADGSSKGAARLADSDEERYPLFPIPAHRATCPICLVDYEEASASVTAEGTQAIEHTSPSAPTDNKADPLRLLRCGHVMHKACVDQWLTAVSGRCPVCQRPVIGSSKDDEEQERRQD
jgi:hypothetical protein